MERPLEFGHQIVRETVRYAFEVLHLHRIELFVFDFNQSAISCYDRIGFQKEGLHRDVVSVDGKWRHWLTMSILEHEWNPPGED